MCAAWKKKNERNEIVCFYCTQPDILLCGIARFSRGNKGKLKTFQPQKWKKKIKNSQPETKFIGFYKKKSVFVKIVQSINSCGFFLSINFIHHFINNTITSKHDFVLDYGHLNYFFESHKVSHNNSKWRIGRQIMACLPKKLY